MHSLASPQVAGCTLVSSSNRLRHINSPLLLLSSLFSWFSVFFFFLRVIHKTPLSSAQLQLQRLNGLCIDCSFSNAAASPKKYQKRVITQGERGGWRLKREGDSCPKSGCIFNFIFAPEDEESNRGARISLCRGNGSQLYCNWAAAAGWRHRKATQGVIRLPSALRQAGRKNRDGGSKICWRGVHSSPENQVAHKGTWRQVKPSPTYRPRPELAAAVWMSATGSPTQLWPNTIGTAAMCAGSRAAESQQWSNNGESCCDSECKWTTSTAVRMAVGTARRNPTAHKQTEVCKHMRENTLKHPPSTHTHTHTQIHARSKRIYTSLQIHICTFILTLSLTHTHTHTHTHWCYFICTCQHLSALHHASLLFFLPPSPIPSLRSSHLSRC